MENKALKMADNKIIQVYIFDNVKNIKGIIQLVHGALEYAFRYQEMIAFLNKKGYIVVTNDLRGHGNTDPLQRGYIGNKKDHQILILDLIAINKYIQKKYFDKKIFIYGHSFGSLLSRILITKSDVKCNGVIISGSGFSPKIKVAGGLILINLIGKIYGDKHFSKLVNNLIFANFNKTFAKKSKMNNEWLSDNVESNYEYFNNSLKSKMFAISGFRALISSMKEACSKKNLKRTRIELPILLISGGQDPVGNFGKDIAKLEQKFQQQGIKDLQKIIYPNNRHEIHMGSVKNKVFNDIANWLVKRN